MCPYVCVYIYIYIYKQREREIQNLTCFATVGERRCGVFPA